MTHDEFKQQLELLEADVADALRFVNGRGSPVEDSNWLVDWVD